MIPTLDPTPNQHFGWHILLCLLATQSDPFPQEYQFTSYGPRSPEGLVVWGFLGVPAQAGRSVALRDLSTSEKEGPSGPTTHGVVDCTFSPAAAPTRQMTGRTLSGSECGLPAGVGIHPVSPSSKSGTHSVCSFESP